MTKPTVEELLLIEERVRLDCESQTTPFAVHLVREEVETICIALRERLVGEQQAAESKRRFIANESSYPEPSDGKE